MLRSIPTKRLNTVFVLALLFLVIELLTHGAGMITGVAILVFLAYIGWKQYETSFGKLLCWIGIIGLIIQLLSLFAVQFFIIAVLVLLVLEYRRGKNTPESMEPQTAAAPRPAALLQTEPLFQQRFAGTQATAEEPYQWRDINIQTGVGSKTIDLSNTVIRDTAVVSIRHLLGPVTILVPYDLEVQVSHSAFYGKLNLFEETEEKLLNESVSFQTEGYDEAKSRVKIVTSLLSGDLEVKRV
ncbi:cell wall-active antibiotics response protein LiaF [Alkalicoccus halolimnae]|uniref:Cell wall-active antibiotics response protein LiaF n=1 Tax=Alkalicoccus halolimnae TaxID=1667239 RepID=A0A5C7F5D2_9BACI|nr:cell wall-active antibiotics response protein LiaF [Alkalicoccus halolimnae]TXF85822.1 hypothetical protein FTX54_07015 [Alkalicoccus halolimnae]